MSQKLSRKQRTQQNAIRTIARREMQQMAKEVAIDAIEAYNREDRKQEPLTAEDIKRTFNMSRLFPQLIPKTDEELTADAAEIYEKLGVPYGTLLCRSQDNKLMVYPEYALPKDWRKQF